MELEIQEVEDDREALLFAIGCLWGGCREAAAHRLSSVTEGMRTMSKIVRNLKEPRNAGLAVALAATCLGLFYLLAAAAPARYLTVNAAAFLLGAVALFGFAGAGIRAIRFTGLLVLALAASLLATALFGASAEGASRWIRIGPLGVQLSLVVLPLMILLYARNPDRIGTAGIVVAAAALALQPDRGMAGVLTLATGVLLLARRERSSAIAFAAALGAFAATMLRPDALPASPYVDRILFTAFEIHVGAGAAVLLGAAILPIPALVGWRYDPPARSVYAVFAAVWIGCILAAILGNYPTPVVGYGGSAILGYLLSLAPFRAEVLGKAACPGFEAAEEREAGPLPRSALAA